MPTPVLRWWHVMIGTYCAWLPGDARGFHSRGHRIHSSGDYKNPPPADEHAGLRRYHKRNHPEPLKIPYAVRRRIAETIAKVLADLGYWVLIVSVSQKHVHILARLPVDLRDFNRIVGICKNKSSRAITDVLPGRVWARGDTHKMVRNRVYLRRVYLYLRDEQGPGAVAWCHQIIFD